MDLWRIASRITANASCPNAAFGAMKQGHRKPLIDLDAWREGVDFDRVAAHDLDRFDLMTFDQDESVFGVFEAAGLVGSFYRLACFIVDELLSKSIAGFG